ncbi:hypothetical protein D5R93_01985 [Actinomyces lilanjuaniae]|uniref:Translocation protein TolB n=1 Tax=Actinomyces lilanjuaniae TaxID=2321394 RepID=A0ABN5PLQ5_9ACTO|nr:WD40 repeat domain-containing protein [Actinomyces lilanjuaniae]AYD89128.1 hypothetical protein D5R93_01985 [Actinomyces lilanjuaniae]
MTEPSETSESIDPREVSLYTGHFDGLWGLAWSPDGSRILSGSHDGTARVWDAATGREVFALTGHSMSVNAVAWSPDGSHLATSSEDHTARVWDAATGEHLLTLEVGGEGVGGALAWSPDSTRLLTHFGDAEARIWDTATGQAVRTLAEHTSKVTAVAWSPDRTRVATASDDGTARVWDVTTGTGLLHVGPLPGAAAHPDGNPTGTNAQDDAQDPHGPAEGAAGAEDVRHTENATEDAEDVEPMTGIAWSPDSRHLITAFDGTLPRVWDAVTGEEVVSLTSPGTDLVSTVAWSPDGTRVLTDNLRAATAHVWDPVTGTEQMALSGHDTWACSLAWSPDSTRVATGSYDRTVRVWDAATGQALAVLGPGCSVETASWSPDGTRVVVGTTVGPTRVWDLTTGETAVDLEATSGELSTVSWSPDGTRLAVDSYYSESVAVLDAATGRLERSLGARSAAVNAFAWSPDGSRALTGVGLDLAVVWDVGTGEVALRLEGHHDVVTSVAWSPNGARVLTASQDGTAQIWDTTTGQAVHTFSHDWLREVVWTRGGPRVVTGSREGIGHVWDAITGGELVTLAGDGAMLRSFSWSPDGKRVAAGFNDGTVRVWDEVAGTEVLRLEGHRFGITTVQWSPDGTRVLTGSEDGTLRLWDAATGEATGIMLCFLPDGQAAALDTATLGLRAGSQAVWDYLGRSVLADGQRTRLPVEPSQAPPLPSPQGQSSPSQEEDAQGPGHIPQEPAAADAGGHDLTDVGAPGGEGSTSEGTGAAAGTQAGILAEAEAASPDAVRPDAVGSQASRVTAGAQADQPGAPFITSSAPGPWDVIPVIDSPDPGRQAGTAATPPLAGPTDQDQAEPVTGSATGLRVEEQQAEDRQVETPTQAPAPWGDPTLRRQVHAEVEEFVAVLARRDLYELASRYGISGDPLAALDQQLERLPVPASELELYPLERADDYVNDHHRLTLSELDGGGGAVIESELWHNGADTGARLVAHWVPMGIFQFDFRELRS